MGRKLKWFAGIIGGLAIAAGVTAYAKRDDLTRLMNVNALFDEGRIIGNFSNMQNLFFNVVVPKSGETYVWPQTKRAIADSYQWQGESKSVADWLAKTSTTSLVVIKDGDLVFEDYYLGTKADIIDLATDHEMRRSSAFVPR